MHPDSREFIWTVGARRTFMALGAFTSFAWFSYVAFVKNPQNLLQSDWFPLIFAYSFRIFAQFHVVLCAAALFTLYGPRLNLKFFRALASVYLVSLCAELGGTSVGFMFGKYTYSTSLGPKILGFVPMLVPLSWFLVSSCAFGISADRFAGVGIMSKCKRIFSTAALIVLWDLTLDPCMSSVFSYWHWDAPYPFYFGAPWTNFLGWSVTGLAIGTTLEHLHFRELTRQFPVRLLIAYYFLFTILSYGFLLSEGVYLPVTLASLGYFAYFLIFIYQEAKFKMIGFLGPIFLRFTKSPS